MYVIIDFDAFSPERAAFLKRRLEELIAERIEPLFADDDPIDAAIVRSLDGLSDLQFLDVPLLKLATLRQVVDSLMNVIIRLRPGREALWEKRVAELAAACAGIRDQMNSELVADAGPRPSAMH